MKTLSKQFALGGERTPKHSAGRVRRNRRTGPALVLALALAGIPLLPAHAGDTNSSMKPVTQSTSAPTATPAMPMARGSAGPGREAVVQTATKTVVRTTANLSLRLGPSTAHRRLKVLPKGTTVVPTGSKSGVWWEVKAAGKTGWVSSRYLESTKASTATYLWSTHDVNVREGPGTNRRVYGVLSAWQRVTYYKTTRGWSYIKTPRGTKGWISNKYLSKHAKYDVAVYGTLRRGQSAYFLIDGKTTSETKTKVMDHALYLRSDKTWWSYMLPNDYSRNVIAERMEFKSSVHTATLAKIDEWERYDPTKPLDNQNYNRKLVKDASGTKVWGYVASKSMTAYMKKTGILVVSGDYLNRY